MPNQEVPFFSIYTNSKVTDKVGPHDDLLGEFPYLGPPHLMFGLEFGR
jgi:hypothetical protein